MTKLEEIMQSARPEALARPITDLDLGVRAENGLKNEGCLTLGDLTDWTDSQLLRIPNFGRMSLNELKAAVAVFVGALPIPVAKPDDPYARGLHITLTPDSHRRLEAMAKRGGVAKQSLAADLLAESVKGVALPEPELRDFRERDIRIWREVSSGRSKAEVGREFNLSGRRIAVIFANVDRRVRSGRSPVRGLIAA